MDEEQSQWDDYVQSQRKEKGFVFQEDWPDPYEVTIRQLRDLLLGLATEPSGSTTWPEGTRVRIDGGRDRKIHIVQTEDDRHDADPRFGQFLDLRNLTGPLGGPLPPLIIENCEIEGTLDLSGSHFAHVEILGCALRGIKGDACRIDSDCQLRDLQPLGVTDSGAGLGAPENLYCYCQIRLVSARIDGTVDLSNSQLRAPRLMDWREDLQATHKLPPFRFADQYALSLAGSEIRGRVFISGNFEAWGGISLYQTEIRNSLMIAARIVAAHEVREFSYGVVEERSYAALDASELRLHGTLDWTPAVEADAFGGNVYGRVDLVRAQIDGDIFLQNLRWKPLIGYQDGRETRDKIDRPYLPNEECVPADCESKFASGGIDGRYARIKGQVRIGRNCRIGRRYRTMSGLAGLHAVAPALDFWKATIGLGVRLEEGVDIHGPIHLNTSHVGRHIFIAAKIIIETKERPRLSPYHVALDLADSRLDGFLSFRIPRSDGRVSLERMQVKGSMEVRRLAFRYRGVGRPLYQPRVRPVSDGLPSENPEFFDAASLERFDETSILDMQDLTVDGGVNFKRESVSIDFDLSYRPHNNFIVDLRGMSCTTWDDADATCWSRLNCKDPREGVPWRLRFDGIDFARLDTSSQPQPLRHNTTDGISPVYRPLAWVLSRWYKSRSYTVASSEQVTALRRKALESFHENRNYQPATLPVRGNGYSHGPTERLPALRRMMQHVERWTILPSWKRREVMPPFSPQPYETFARAYMARGETDTAIKITIDRMRRQWRRRVRLWTQGWTPIAVLILILTAWGFVWASLLGQEVSAWTYLFWTGVAILPPFALRLIVAVWEAAFGYGLSSTRAVGTVVIFVLFCSFATPLIVGDRFVDGRESVEHLVYGIDKLIPLNEPDMILYPESPQCIQMRPEPRRIPIAHPEPEYLPYHADAPRRPCLYRQLNRIYDLIGWIIISLTLLTLAGLFRRDIERPNGG